MRRDHDIKAPDGYLLGGLRKVLKDRTILFQRGYWGPVPSEWVGDKVWVHCTDGGAGDLEVAPPGRSLWERGSIDRNFFAPRTERRDAKELFRRKAHRAWGKA